MMHFLIPRQQERRSREEVNLKTTGSSTTRPDEFETHLIRLRQNYAYKVKIRAVKNIYFDSQVLL